MSAYQGRGPSDPLGAKGEDLAAEFLRQQGYKVVERNYAFATGEIDIIALEGEVLTFVEVKTRSSTDFGPPVLAVDYRKQRHLQRAAERFIVQKKLRRPLIRYDIVSVVLSGGDGKPEFTLFRNAF